MRSLSGMVCFQDNVLDGYGQLVPQRLIRISCVVDDGISMLLYLRIHVCLYYRALATFLYIV